MMGIFGKAVNGDFTRQMEQTGNQMFPGSYRSSANEDEVVKASKWISHASGSFEHLNCPVTERDVAEAIRYVSSGISIFSADTLKYIRRKTYFGPKASYRDRALSQIKKFKPQFRMRRQRFNIDDVDMATHNVLYQTHTDTAIRWATSLVPYPGTIAGQHFLYNSVFPKARTLNSQLAGRAANQTGGAREHRGTTAMDLACFALGTFVAAHPFKDGNGRTARVLYAGILLAHGRPFVAPTISMENRLNGLRTPDPNVETPLSNHFDFFDVGRGLHF
ncbi:hypothetical protein FMN50_19540 [Rhodobacterales bacterium]|nr:hypothetical protein FMN50_19540 [Rhodobacterales bacterium]